MWDERPRLLLQPLHLWLLAISVTGALLWRVLPAVPLWGLLALPPLLLWPAASRSLAALRLGLGGVLLFLLLHGPGTVPTPSPATPHPWIDKMPTVKALVVKPSLQAAGGLESLLVEARQAAPDPAPTQALRVEGWWYSGQAWLPLPGTLSLWPHARRAPVWPAPGWCLILPRSQDSLQLELPMGPVGPFMPDPRQQEWERGRVGRLRLDSLQLRLHALGPPARAPSGWRRALDDLRAACARRLLEGTGRGGPWMVAILLGEQAFLPRDEVALWQRTGLAHLLAVSGLNTGVLALALWQGLAPLPLRRGWKETLLALLLLLYLPLAAWQVSVKRAVGMALILLAGRSLERPQDGLGALALTASLMLWLDPAELGHPGFLMSCGAVAALILGMREPVHQPLTGRPGSLWKERGHAVGRGLLQALRISAVAQVGTAVFQLSSFGTLPLSGMLLNLVAVPLSSVLTIAAFLHLILPLPGEPLGALCQTLAAAITWCAAHTPVLSVNWEAHPFQLALLAVASVGILLPWPRVRLELRLGLAALILLGAADLLPRLQQPHAWICLFNAGQGDAVLLSGPAGQGVLVDTGWDDPRGTGTRGMRLAQACSRLQPRPPDWLVLTHADQDHLGGAEGLLQRMPICSVLWNGEWKENPPQQRLRHLLEVQGQHLATARPGLTLQAAHGWRVRVLAPPPVTAGVDGNERSIVLRVESPQGPVLLTGDAGHHEEAWLLGWGPWLRSRWLKLGHHGSRGSSSAPFLQAVGAAEGWISCGLGNRYGHPHAELLQALAGRMLRVHRTDRQGWRWLSLDGRTAPQQAMSRPRIHWSGPASRAPPSR